jgi:outer membrane putative beta-barrel porin/alpha-amylase
MNCCRIVAAAITLFSVVGCAAQELEPRAYSVSPKGANFAVIGVARSTGDINFDPSLPIEDASAVLQVAFVAYGRALDFFGRSANLAVTVPYLWGSLEGKVNDSPQLARRSGLANPAMRFAVNLYGAPAMDFQTFARYRQKTNIGASVAIVAPLGQYDPARLVNIGTNRWGAKPEIGLSRRVGRWYADLYLGAWIFSANDNYQGRVRKQDPIGIAQLHISYNFRPRLWAAFDANYYTGGRTNVNGVAGHDLQRNSRLGATISIPAIRRQSLKFSVSRGAVTTIGGDFLSFGVAYQYLWGGGL